MPRREYHSSYVCVTPGGPPEEILDMVEYIVSRVVFLLFLFSGSNFLRRKQIFYRENICRKNLLAYDWPVNLQQYKRNIKKVHDILHFY